MDYIGKSPVSVPELITGKLAFLFSALFFIVKDYAADSMLYDSPVTRGIGVLLFAIGFTMTATSLLQLGNSAAVGLPERETELKTGGLYRYTRNPIYTGAFVMCAGSCFYSIHPVNFLLSAVAIVVHVRIILREEEFLERRFGDRWREYKSRVPRFLGIPGQPAGR